MANVAVATMPLQPQSIYIIQPVARLPVVDVNHTVLGALAGRKRARQADALIIRVATQYNTLWHVLETFFAVATVLLFLIGDLTWRPVITAAVVVPIVPVLVVHTLALCWDLLVLVLGTFEFWFLLVTNYLDNLLWNLLFHDVRVYAMVTMGFATGLILFLDANLWMRVVVLRLFVFGAPGLLFGIVMVDLRLTPDLVYPSLDLWGQRVDSVDVIISGTSTVIFFMLMRTFRYRKIVFSFLHRPQQQATGAAVVPVTASSSTSSSSSRTGSATGSGGASAMVRCDMYFPVCRLVPYEEWQQQRRASLAHGHHKHPAQRQVASSAKSQLELVERDQLRLIDARDTLWSHCHWRLANSSWGGGGLQTQRMLVWSLQTCGLVGSSSFLLACGLQYWYTEPSFYLPSSLLALATTTGFLIIHVAHFQRSLFSRISHEIDAWFVSFQVTIVTLGTCDVLLWDSRILVVLTAWLWSHWLLFLDALPPSTRKRLGLSHWFVLFVNASLFVYPLWLVGVLFYSNDQTSTTTTRLRNRVIFKVHVAQQDLVMETLSLLSSRIFTAWLWMGRFLWREVRRPVDAFKFIKYKVHLEMTTTG